MLCHFEKLKHIQKIILEFLDDDENQNFQIPSLKQYLDNNEVRENQQDIKLILHLISKISNNHYRTHQFFKKMECILILFKDEMKKYFSNFDIFNIFKGNKAILLFLFEENIILFDDTIKKIMFSFQYNSKLYSLYFSTINKLIMNENDFNAFEEKRKIGENDNYICQLIRDDLIDDFIVYVNKTNYPLSSKISLSIFETNNFLLKNDATLIEYAAFFGSIQIFNYLRMNNAKISPSLWLYAIHGNKAELIYILEENHIEYPKEALYAESVKCHHIDIMNYIKNNLFGNETENDINMFLLNLKYFNFDELANQIQMFERETLEIFYYCCKYDFYFIVEHLLKTKKININELIKTISISFYNTKTLDKIVLTNFMKLKK